MKNFAAIATLAALLAAAPARAQVIYDNINGYTWGTGDASPGWSVFHPGSTAQYFTAAASGTVGTVTVAVQQSSGGGTPAGTISIWSSNASQTAVASLGSVSFSGAPAWNSGSVLSVAGPAVSLSAGSGYFILLTPNENAGFEWRYTSPSTSGRGASRSQLNGNWTYFNSQPMGGFRIEAVPEPASLAALACGAALLFRRRSRGGR